MGSICELSLCAGNKENKQLWRICWLSWKVFTTAFGKRYMFARKHCFFFTISLFSGNFSMGDHSARMCNSKFHYLWIRRI